VEESKHFGLRTGSPALSLLELAMLIFTS